MSNPFMDDPFSEDGGASGIAVRASASPSLPSPAAVASPAELEAQHAAGFAAHAAEHAAAAAVAAASPHHDAAAAAAHEAAAAAAGGMADVRFDAGPAPAPAAYDAFPAPYAASPYVPSAYVPPTAYAPPGGAEPPSVYEPRGTFSSLAPPPSAAAASSAPPAAAMESSEPVSTHLEGPRPSAPPHHAWEASASASAPAPSAPSAEHKGERVEGGAVGSASAAYISFAASAPASAPRAEEKSRYIIMVTDPEKKGDGISSFVAYKITTMKEVEGRTTQSVVFRRFSEFVWLHDRLSLHHKGCIIPPMPEKAITGRGTQEFIQERRRGLEVFLNRVAVHRELRHSEDVELFITADEATFAAAKSKKEKDDVKAAEASASASAAAEAPSPQKKGIMAMFQQTVQSISNSVGSGKERPKSEGDLMCDKIQQYADALDLQLKAVHLHADVLIKQEKSLAKTWFDFGNACTHLGQYEAGQKQAELGTVFAHLGNCADRLSIMLGKRADTENINFREPIRDYIRMVNSVKNMLKSRAGVLLWYQTTLSALESRQAKVTELQGKAGKEKALAAAEMSVHAAQQECDNATRELNRVTELALAETQRFRAEKHKDLQQVIIEFVKLQIEDGKQVGRAWEGILEEIVPKPGAAGAGIAGGASP